MVLGLFDFLLLGAYQIDGNLEGGEAVFTGVSHLERFTITKALMLTVFGSGMNCRDWLNCC